MSDVFHRDVSDSRVTIPETFADKRALVLAESNLHRTASVTVESDGGISLDGFDADAVRVLIIGENHDRGY